MTGFFSERRVQVDNAAVRTVIGCKTTGCRGFYLSSCACKFKASESQCQPECITPVIPGPASLPMKVTDFNTLFTFNVDL